MHEGRALWLYMSKIDPPFLLQKFASKMFHVLRTSNISDFWLKFRILLFRHALKSCGNHYLSIVIIYTKIFYKTLICESQNFQYCSIRWFHMISGHNWNVESKNLIKISKKLERLTDFLTNFLQSKWQMDCTDV